MPRYGRQPNGILSAKLLGIKQRIERNLEIMKNRYQKQHEKNGTWNDYTRGKLDGIVQCYEDLLSFIADQNGSIYNPAPKATEKQRYLLRQYEEEGYLTKFDFPNLNINVISKKDASLIISQVKKSQQEAMKEAIKDS